MIENVTLFDLAIDMLEKTNPYTYSIEEFKHGAYILSDLIKRTIGRRSRSVRQQGGLQKDYEVCYEAISSSMLIYLENFQTNSYAYKQETWRLFSKWIRKIEKRYKIPKEQWEVAIKERVKVSDGDAVVAVVKALHDKSGKTVEQIVEETNMGERVVQKWIKRLSEGNCRLAGQPINVKVKVLSKKNERAPRYRTVNTMHPLVLQQNVLQIGTLLQSLAHNYVDNDSEVSFSIGVEIWYQLSEYGRNRIKEYFMIHDPKLNEFVNDIESRGPNETGRRFWTERDMEEELPLSELELLTYVEKVDGRLCNINLKEEKEVLYNQRLTHEVVDGETIYQSIAEDGSKTVEFKFDDLEWVEIVHRIND